MTALQSKALFLSRILWPFLCTFSLGMTDLTAPETQALPSHSLIKEWDEAFALQVSRELRKRLLLECADISTTASRKDWLLHMILQTHHLPNLIELVEEFNLAQRQSSSNEKSQVLELQFHELGFKLNRSPLKLLS